jgi:ribose transport system ATP-binding protein
MADREVVLGVRDVSKNFASIRALDNASMSLHRGEALALIGANGAGKSTLVRILTGATEPDTGSVVVDGQVQRLRSVREARQRGIGFVPQELAENLLAGGWQHARGLVRTKPSIAEVTAATQRVGLAARPGQLVSQLSPGERRLAMIARALVMHPRTLILDEPTAALADREADRVLTVLRELRGEGISIIFISHRMAEIERLCDTVVVLRDGRVVMEAPATAESVARSVAVGMAGGAAHLLLESAGLPSTVATETVPDETVPDETVTAETVTAETGIASGQNGVALRCRDLRNRALGGVTFEVRTGEIVGLAGLLGSGRTEILRALAGADELAEGEIEVYGQAMSFRSPAHAIAAGVVLIPEDRRNEGGLLSLSIRENLVLPAIPAWRGGWLRRSAERRLAAEAVRIFGIKCSSPEAQLLTLSGGNQQKVILARWLLTGARVLLLDEPTAGIDVVAKGELMSLVTAVVRQGRAAVMVSSELAELCEYCDRIYVVRNGAIRAVAERGISVAELARLCGERSVVLTRK